VCSSHWYLILLLSITFIYRVFTYSSSATIVLGHYFMVTTTTLFVFNLCYSNYSFSYPNNVQHGWSFLCPDPTRLECDSLVDHFFLRNSISQSFSFSAHLVVGNKIHVLDPFSLFVFRLSCIQSVTLKSLFNKQSISYVFLSHVNTNSEVEQKGWR
jgi:hypothetical protein